MPIAETLRALIALVEEAKAGSRELDARIWWEFADHSEDSPSVTSLARRKGPIAAIDQLWPFGWRNRSDDGIPAVTTSIDAALALVAKVLPGWFMCLCIGDAVGPPSISMHRHQPSSKMVAFEHSTPQLVIIRAMLEALLIEDVETAHVER